jgi:hypothetical protein
MPSATQSQKKFPTGPSQEYTTVSPGHIRNHGVGVPPMLAHFCPAATQDSPDQNGLVQPPCAATGGANRKVEASSADATMKRNTIFFT